MKCWNKIKTISTPRWKERASCCRPSLPCRLCSYYLDWSVWKEEFESTGKIYIWEIEGSPLCEELLKHVKEKTIGRWNGRPLWILHDSRNKTLYEITCAVLRFCRECGPICRIVSFIWGKKEGEFVYRFLFWHSQRLVIDGLAAIIQGMVFLSVGR